MQRPGRVTGDGLAVVKDTQSVYCLCMMATKTISLRLEAYERLRRAKRDGESFSDVVMRARWDDVPVTGRELLSVMRERGPVYTSRELDAVEALEEDVPSDRDKWSTG